MTYIAHPTTRVIRCIDCGVEIVTREYKVVRCAMHQHLRNLQKSRDSRREIYVHHPHVVKVKAVARDHHAIKCGPTEGDRGCLPSCANFVMCRMVVMSGAPLPCMPGTEIRDCGSDMDAPAIKSNFGFIAWR